MFPIHRIELRSLFGRRACTGPRGVAALAAALLTAACAGGGDGDLAEARMVSGFAGFAAAHEPRAALVGRSVLAQNGTAADAAVAMAFTMTVTMPSRVGLGGGGACVVHDNSDGRTEALLFLPESGTRGGGTIPGLARGLAALHARYGARDWRMLVAPSEQLARFGHVVSRAFHKDLVRAAPRLGPQARERFLRDGRRVPEVGEQLRHEALSASLSGLRQQGAGYIYVGAFARRLADAAGGIGQPLEPGTLSAYRARYVETLKVPYGNHQLHLPPPPVLGGLAAGQLWGMLRRSPNDSAEMTPDGAHFLIEAWKRTLSERRVWRETPEGSRPDPQGLVDDTYLERRLAALDPGAATPASRLSPPPTDLGADAATAGFAVADRFGNIVACDFTMNGLFGTGREAGSTGILMAGRATPENAGAGLAPAILANPFTSTAFLAVSGADGTAGQLALGELVRKMDAVGALQTGGGDIDLASYLAMPRLHHPGRPDEVRIEPDLPVAIADRLRNSGHTLVKASGLGRLQAVYCPQGIRENARACQVATDPRGHGLAVRAQ